jgi:class 3 adenylate cyclase/tetratricopeptide (TPR) repeat protein
VQCSACHVENPAGSRFCNGCGSPIAPACRSCGHENPPGAAFCNGCGTPIGQAPDATEESRQQEPSAYTPGHLAERILRTRAALEGERKNVTVLFCDLADSTPLTERVDSEEMHALMDRAFKLILEQVHQYDGTVNQFLGDGVMALFGAPLAIENAPRCAVTAALGIHRALQPLHSEVRARHGSDFKMRIGINSGPVVVGRIGDDLRMDYTAVGDTTILAERLQKLAVPGGIMISDATEHLISGYFELEDLGALGVKGKSEPVHAYQVDGARSVVGRIEAAVAEGLTPLVGRARELEILTDAFGATREGRGQIVFLVGEAGIGKSRLLHEFSENLGDDSHTWMLGRCASYARNSPYYAMIDAVRLVFGIQDTDLDDAAIAKFENSQLTKEGLEWTVPYLCRLLSLPVSDERVAALDAASRRSETFRALQALLFRATADVPLVLVIEDLHWIDHASEDLLGFLAESVPASRVMLLLTHRPGYAHPFGDRSYHTRLNVPPLSSSDIGAIAGSVLGATSLPEALEELIGQKADGNPFFVEEVAKSLLEDGSLERVDGRVELTRPLEDISVPDSIQDVLAARLDRLEDAPKHALQVAAVIGREFALRLWSRIFDMDEGLDDVVEELRSLELIYEKIDNPELAFRFKHALTCDVAYESVLRSRRKVLHRIVGVAIQELYADRLSEHLSALAHHFTLAEDWQLAYRYHRDASIKSAQAFANQSAAEHCRQALSIAADLADVAAEELQGLEQRLADVYFCMSEFGAAGDAYLRAADLAPEPVVRALDLGKAAYSFHWAHDYARDGETLEQALAFSRDNDLEFGESMALLVKGFRAGTLEGDLEGFERLGEQGARLRGDSAELLAFTRLMQGYLAEWRGDFPTAITTLAESAEIARRIELPAYLGPAQWFHGKALCANGQYADGIAKLEEGLEFSQRIGDRAHRTRILNTLGWCHAEFGAHDRAADYNEQSVELAAEMVELKLVPGAPELYGNASINLACNRIALGQLDAASEILTSIQRDIEGEEDPWMRWRYQLHLLDALARLALARGEPEDALTLLDRELAGARHHGARKLETRALELQARACLHIDRRPEAEEALRNAVEVGERISYAPALWRSYSLQGELFRRVGDTSLAERSADRAHGLIESLKPALPDERSRRDFSELGRLLVSDPLGAYR